MRIRYTRHAAVESMPDRGITGEEVEEAMRKSSETARESKNKYRFYYRDLEVVAQKERGYWLVVTCYRRE